MGPEQLLVQFLIYWQKLSREYIVTQCFDEKEGADPAEDHDMLRLSLTTLQLCLMML